MPPTRTASSPSPFRKRKRRSRSRSRSTLVKNFNERKNRMNTLVRDNRSAAANGERAQEQFITPPATVLENAVGYTGRNPRGLRPVVFSIAFLLGEVRDRTYLRGPSLCLQKLKRKLPKTKSRPPATKTSILPSSRSPKITATAPSCGSATHQLS